jgi:acetate kinase
MSRHRKPGTSGMPDLILVLNAGSSSLKFGLFSRSETDVVELVVRGGYENLGKAPQFTAKNVQDSFIAKDVLHAATELPDIVQHLLAWLAKHFDAGAIRAVGHRIVHGGPSFVSPVQLTDDKLAALAALTPLAPLHQPACLAPVQILQRLRPGMSQIGCFDTAFHHNLTPPANRYALPYSYEQQGVRKYGFHGLSYEYIAGCLREMSPQMAKQRTVVAHLGSGCSLCALREGISVDTTMGYTPLDGLMMGTRSGSLDPGILLHLLRERRMTVDTVEDLLYHQSGLLGVSGISADVRDLLGSDRPEASEAIDLFVFRIAQGIAAMAASLQGLDVLVFTGGIGEHSPQIRALVCDRLKWLNVELSSCANDANKSFIGAKDSGVAILMFPANEEVVIARNMIRSGLVL